MLLKSLSLVLFLITTLLTTNAQSNKMNYQNKPFPEIVQKGKNSEKPGAYSQILNANKTTLSAGESIIIQHYITGYGFIEPTTAKIVTTSSSNIFDETNSEVLSDFGRNPHQFYNSGTTGGLGAILIDQETGKEQTMFNDASFLTKKIGTTQIVLEQNAVKENNESISPFKWVLKTKKEIKPGNYYLTFVLTYFNGNSWQNDKIELPIKIMTWYEKQASYIQITAWIIAVLTILSLILSAPSSFKDFKLIFSKSVNEIEVPNTNQTQNVPTDLKLKNDSTNQSKKIVIKKGIGKDTLKKKK
tara:strand:- start:1351 stop:2253 length:903 start_codon:yes stop_codon:yes gene_type:complete